MEPFCGPYATLSDDSLTVTFYYDGYMKSRNGMAIGDYFGLYGKEQTYTNATIAVFDDSFADYYPSVTGYWFAGCNNLKEIKGISNLKTDSVTEMADMFYGCSNLTSLDLSGFNTDNVKDMEYMFHGCSSLASIDLSGFKTDSVTNMVYMFNSCSRLSTIYAGDGWSTSNVENSVGMFSGCRNLIGGQGTKFNSSYTDHTYARIDGGVEAPGYFTSKENTGIRNVNSGGALAVELIYDVKGVKHNSYRKGLNIIHMNGGMTKKLIVK